MPHFQGSYSEHNIELPPHATGQVYTICPKCSSDRKKKKVKCLSVNTDEGVWNCHHCGWIGGLKKSVKTFRLPPPLPAKLDISERAHEWLKDRGLSDYTLQRFKIHSTRMFFPKVQKERSCIAFPYIRNDQLINTKYRDAEKNFAMDKGAELIFFNLDSLQGQEYCIITEGEIDAMSAYEAGWKQAVVSVPNGAQKKRDPNDSMKLEYIDNCYGHFDDLKCIILATDNDEPGIELRNELARRFGKHRCFYVVYPEGIKDLNQLLMEQGPEAVIDCISVPIPFPIDNVNTIRDFERDMDSLFENGIDRGLDTGFRTLDEHVLHRRGELTISTGIPGSGKSAFEDQISSRLAAKHGWRTAFCSFEKQPAQLHAAKLASLFVGKRFFFGDNRMSKEEYTMAKEFISDHFYFFNFFGIKPSIDHIIDKAIQLVLTRGIEKLVIDPWNYLIASKPEHMPEADYILDSLLKLLVFAKNYNVAVVVVAHPTKQQKNKDTGKYDAPTLYSISGSAHWFNCTDNGYCVYRDMDTNEVWIIVQKIRWDFVGKVGQVQFAYQSTTGLYAETGYDFIPDCKYYARRLGILHR